MGNGEDDISYTAREWVIIILRRVAKDEQALTEDKRELGMAKYVGDEGKQGVDITKRELDETEQRLDAQKKMEKNVENLGREEIGVLEDIALEPRRRPDIDRQIADLERELIDLDRQLLYANRDSADLIISLKNTLKKSLKTLHLIKTRNNK